MSKTGCVRKGLSVHSHCISNVKKVVCGHAIDAYVQGLRLEHQTG